MSESRPPKVVIAIRGGSREYVVAKARCRNCDQEVRQWKTEFEDREPVTLWKHSDGVVLCDMPQVATPVESTIIEIRDEA